MINTLMEEEGPNRVPVRLGQDCAMLAGHLSWFHAWVEGGTLRKSYLFEPTHPLNRVHCQFEAQMVEVANGPIDLYVEHRCAGPAIALPAGMMLGELRQLGATKVTTSHKRTDLCHTIYQICRKHLTTYTPTAALT